MAVGDVYNTPAIRKNRNLTIEGGGTVTDWNVETPLEFNRNEWELIAIAVGVNAQQSYMALTGTVRLDMTYAIRNYNSSGDSTDSPLGINSLDWWHSFGEPRSAIFGRDIQGTSLARTALYITANYKLPWAAASPQNCNTTIDMAFSFRAKVANPTTTPFAGPPKEGGGAMNLDLGWILVVGVLGIVGLVALGWAAEKTGVNVGVLGGMYTEGKKLIGGAGKALKVTA